MWQKSQCPLSLLALPFGLPPHGKGISLWCQVFAALVLWHTSSMPWELNDHNQQLCSLLHLHSVPISELKSIHERETQYTKPHPKHHEARRKPSAMTSSHSSWLTDHTYSHNSSFSPPSGHSKITHEWQGSNWVRYASSSNMDSRHVIKNDSIRYIYQHRQGHFFSY